MNTPAIVVALASAALGLSYLAQDAGPSLDRRPALNPNQSCKPSGPIAVEWTQVQDFGDGSVQLELTLRPLLEMQELSWRLDLEPGMQLLEGQAEGRLELARNALDTRRMRVSLPSGLATGFGRLSVEVSGVFQGSNSTGVSAPERVVVQRTLSWGEPDSALATETFFDAVLGAELSRVSLPAVATPGAGAVYKVGR